MPRPKKVTIESIEEIIRQMKRIKAHQEKKIKINNRSDGQPVYHYPSISKAKIARALGVQADYLTSLQKTNIEIANALKYVGQRRRSNIELEHKPNPGTKAYFKLRVDKQAEEIRNLNKQHKEWRAKILSVRKNEKRCEELVEQVNSLVNELRIQKKKNNDLVSKLRGLEMTNASLNARIVKLDDFN